MVTESRSNCSWCSSIGVMVVAALAAWVCAPAAFAQGCADLPQDRTVPDCNGNGVEDKLDIASLFSEDANVNGIPDECDFQICDDLWDGFMPNSPFSRNKPMSEIDSNDDGTVDWCQDCNRNCIVDPCDISCGSPGGPCYDIQGCGESADCNNNGIPDECDINPTLPLYYMPPPACPLPWEDVGNFYALHGGGSLDSDTNGVPDECQEDCNNNGMLDYCEFDCDHSLCHPPGFEGPPGCGQGVDCNANGTLDDCKEDCNYNGVADECDLTAGTSQDTNGNGTPDECDPDCDGNGTPDDLDIANTPGWDCDTNGILDRCERLFPDCNGDDIEDACDIAAGTSTDYDINGIPDECDPCGDLDEDDEVDEADYWAFVAAFAACVGNPDYHPLADLDGDGCVGLPDYQRWTLCYRLANGREFRLGSGGSKDPTDEIDREDPTEAPAPAQPVGSGTF